MLRPCMIMMVIASMFPLFFFTGCSSDNGMGNGEVIAEINDFALTRDEFQEKLVKEMEYSNAYKTTPEAKKQFLQTLIEKELFIQEAKTLDLDKKKEFTSVIERYWEATLIKHLMEEKNREISHTVSVSENEIKKRYQELKSENNAIPAIDRVEKEIAADLFEMKKTAALNEWVRSLHDKAQISIDSGFINE